MNQCLEFDEGQLKEVDDAVCLAEELVSNYFKMSSAQWLRSRYDVRTAKDLAGHEQVTGPFAQVVGYEARKRNVSLGSSSFNFYKICLQDSAILSALEEKQRLLLFPFLLYVVVHELVHIVRFAKFQQIYEASSTHETAMEEERLVHDLTWKILSRVRLDGVATVLDYYREWRAKPGFDKLV
jgi:hypothetical protein